MKRSIFLITMILFFSCTNENEEDLYSCLDSDSVAWEHSNLSRSISNIIDSKCASCHIDIGVDLSYNLLTLNNAELLQNFITGSAVGYSYSVMPPPGSEPLTSCEEEKILNWINNNYPFDENNR